MKPLNLILAGVLFLGATVATIFGQENNPRADFLKLIARPAVPLAPQVEKLSDTNGLVEFHFSFASDASNRVPGILLKAKNVSGARPVVIVMHGTGGRKEDELPLLRRLARVGFVAVAIDGRYHGERATEGKGSASYQKAIVRAWHGSGEHPFFYDTVWDIQRLVDYLATRDDVDAARIGLTGISKGGIETYFTAAADSRIAVAVPFIGVQSFEWALQNNDWQGRIGTIQNGFNTIAKEEGVTNVTSAFVQKFYDRVTPKIYSEFDGPQMLPLIAPRPLLVINSDHDPNCPLPGVEEAVNAAQKIYAADNATNQISVIIQPNTGHAVKPESERAMIDWFVKWLKP
ncbi:MAG TPA: prolyl oligopeptidase family serine peptidase [Verrucomicrobiae bacterium]|nr:prolyl oligopeptidase family serine peptidase [Verrucomicrobiae bacterium]